MDKYPSHFFKFRPLGHSDPEQAVKALEYTRQIIVEGKVKFSHPNDFNDPFDCKPVVRIERDMRKVRRYYLTLLKERTNLTRQQRRTEAARRLKLPDREHYYRIFNDALIFCLCAEHEHVLMWSHYANHHRGVCVRFGFSRSEPLLCQILPVKYQVERPVLDWVSDRGSPEGLVDSVLLAKADHWAYEREWRIVERRGPEVRRIDPARIDGVYLGACMSDTDETEVRRWCRERGGIEVFKARLDDQDYRLAFERVEP